MIANGENAADTGFGLTEKDFQQIINAGADVVTTGNHVWDEKETMNFISSEKRLLRPENLPTGSPGNGFGIFNSKNNKKVAVINLMGNVHMKRCEDVFQTAKKIVNKKKLKYFKKYILNSEKLDFIDENLRVGVITPDKDIIPDAETLTPAYIVFDNYEIILKWNRSLRFALAVCTLKDKIKNEL